MQDSEERFDIVAKSTGTRQGVNGSKPLVGLARPPKLAHPSSAAPLLPPPIARQSSVLNQHQPSGPIFQRRDACFRRTMRAAEVLPARFQSVPDDPAFAMPTLGCESGDGAFKAVEIMRNAVFDNLKGLVVFVTARFTRRSGMRFGHGAALRGCLEIWLLMFGGSRHSQLA